MSSKNTVKPTGPLDPHYITKVYLPSALLIATVAYVKVKWTPYAVAAAAILAGLQFYGNQVQKVLDPVHFRDFPLIEKKTLSHNTAIYRFALPSKSSILGLPIGQHISLGATLPVTDPKTGTTEERQVVRSYTPISSDHDVGHFDLLIKSYPTGNISKHLASLSIGDKMAVRGPKGAMVYTPGMVKRFGMIAGGTGITPMLQIIKAIRRGRSTGDDTQVALIFANVNEEDILMKDELDAIVAQDDRIRVHYVLNNPPEDWSGGVGFVTADIITAHLPSPSPDMKLLICGPPPMVSAMKKATEPLGYQKARTVSKLEDQVFCF